MFLSLPQMALVSGYLSVSVPKKTSTGDSTSVSPSSFLPPHIVPITISYPFGAGGASQRGLGGCNFLQSAETAERFRLNSALKVKAHLLEHLLVLLCLTYVFNKDKALKPPELYSEQKMSRT